MSTWTKELPKETGFYWFRNDWFGHHPIVVQWAADQQWVMLTGTECIIYNDDRVEGGDTLTNTNAEFWTERLSPPQP